MKHFQMTATVTGIKTTREHRKVMTLRFPMATGLIEELDFFNPCGFELDDQLIVKVEVDDTALDHYGTPVISDPVLRRQ